MVRQLEEGGLESRKLRLRPVGDVTEPTAHPGEPLVVVREPAQRLARQLQDPVDHDRPHHEVALDALDEPVRPVHVPADRRDGSRDLAGLGDGHRTGAQGLLHLGGARQPPRQRHLPPVDGRVLTRDPGRRARSPVEHGQLAHVDVGEARQHHRPQLLHLCEQQTCLGQRLGPRQVCRDLLLEGCHRLDQEREWPRRAACQGRRGQVGRSRGRGRGLGRGRGGLAERRVGQRVSGRGSGGCSGLAGPIGGGCSRLGRPVRGGWRRRAGPVRGGWRRLDWPVRGGCSRLGRPVRGGWRRGPDRGRGGPRLRVWREVARRDAWERARASHRLQEVLDGGDWLRGALVGRADRRPPLVRRRRHDSPSVRPCVRVSHVQDGVARVVDTSLTDQQQFSGFR